MQSAMSKRPAAMLALPVLVAASLVTTACGGGGAAKEEKASGGGSTAGSPTPTPAPTVRAGKTTAAPKPETVPPPADPGVLGVFFPRQVPQRGDVPMAATSGELVVDGAGCLRLVYPDGDNQVPVWPSDYGLGAEDGEIYVLDGEGNAAARIGDLVRVGGGGVGTSLEGIAIVGEQTKRELYERCPSSYWIVGNEVSTIQR